MRVLEEKTSSYIVAFFIRRRDSPGEMLRLRDL